VEKHHFAPVFSLRRFGKRFFRGFSNPVKRRSYIEDIAISAPFGPVCWRFISLLRGGREKPYMFC
jgi:hypothetical protein